MQRREEEARNNLLVAELDRLDQYLGDRWSMTPEFKEQYLRGAGELELVRSGLTTPCALPINKCLNVGTAVMMSRICGRPPLCWRLTKSRQAIARKASKQKKARIKHAPFSLFFKHLSATIAVAVHWLERNAHMCLAIGFASLRWQTTEPEIRCRRIAHWPFACPLCQF